MTTSSRSNSAPSLSAWVIGRVRSLSISAVALIAIAMVIFQSIIIYAQVASTRDSIEDWLRQNRARIEQALFLRDALPIESLIGEIASSSAKNLEALHILGADDVVLYSSGPKEAVMNCEQPGTHQDLINLRVHFSDRLSFADRPVGCLLLRASYNVKALLMNSFFVLLALLMSLFFLNFRTQRLLNDLQVIVASPISKMAAHLRGVDASSDGMPDLSFELSLDLSEFEGAAPELKNLAKAYNRQIQIIHEMAERDRKNAKAVSRAEVAAKVTHDIRSPLSALKIVTQSMPEVNEEKRLLIQSAVKRIEEIASDLLEKSKSVVRELQRPGAPPTPVSLMSVLRSIVTECKLSQAKNPNVDVSCDLNPAFGAFVATDANELKRTLSNLLNNAVESNAGGPVKVEVKTNILGDKCQISISDNGKGIPAHVLSKLGREVVTFGKAGLGGNGLGVLFACRTIRENGGDFEISSSPSRGTKVTITLPVIETPSWFLSQLNLRAEDKLVIVDDETFAHSLWDSLAAPLAEAGRLIHHKSTESFESWWDGLTDEERRHHFCLMDYEFAGEEKTGLDMAAKSNLRDRVALVTGLGYDEELVARAEALSVPVLDKMSVASLPLRWEPQGAERGGDIT